MSSTTVTSTITTTPTSHQQGQNKLKNSSLNGTTTKNQDYSRWRPSYHLIAPYGWVNDPCAPGYNPSTGRYHVGFQWNPNGTEWGDIVWGKAFSTDLVTWEVSETPTLKRDAPYDHAGVFTGCWRPTGLDGQHHHHDDDHNSNSSGSSTGEVTFIYTSVSRLPIHYTKEYHRGCETLSLATSKDGGNTWVKHNHNPILPGPPEGVDVLGWRDPYVAEWPVAERLLESRSRHHRHHPNGDAVEDINTNGSATGESLFALISGGIRHKTPTTWLYKVHSQDLTKWEFVGPVVFPGKNYAPSRWTGDMGVNWEVTNFVSLQAEQYSQEFLIFGAEGCTAPYGGAGVVPGTRRTNRAQLWVAIDPNNDEDTGAADSPLMKYSYGGIFDHGLYYAANGFWDPVSQQQIVVGWVTEEDLPVECQAKQGWSGCLSLPRVTCLTTIHHVSRASKSPLRDITSIKTVIETEAAAAAEGADDDDKSLLFRVQTLGIKPDPRLQKLRAGATSVLTAQAGPVGPVGSQAVRLGPLHTAQWEAYAELANVGVCQRVGILIRHATTTTTSSSLSTTQQQPPTTTLYFTPDQETFVIERPDIYWSQDRSSSGAGESESSCLHLQDETAPFTLFTTRDRQTGTEEEERLRMHIFYDGSVLEVFVNDRVAITTRVYLEDQRCCELEIFAEASDRNGGQQHIGCVLEQGVVWDGVSAAV